MRKYLAVLFGSAVVAGLLTVAAVGQTSPPATLPVAWDANPAGDNVTQYVVAYRPKGSTGAWVEVPVPGNQTTVTLPANPYETEVRAAAVNAFGRSDWTYGTLPASIKGLRFTIEIRP